MLSTRESELVELLIKDARKAVDELDALTKRIVALALHTLEKSQRMFRNLEELFSMYETLTGEHLLEKVREVCARNLLRLHLLIPDYPQYLSSLYWSSYAPHILRALRDKVPEVIVEFRVRQEESE